MKWIENCLKWQVQRAVTSSLIVAGVQSLGSTRGGLFRIQYSLISSVECSLSHYHNFYKWHKTEVVVGTSDCHVDDQKGLDRLKKWMNRKSCEERFNNRKCNVQHLERNNPMHQFTCRANCQVASFWKEGVVEEILVGESWMWASDVPLWQRKPMPFCPGWENLLVRRLRELILPLCTALLRPHGECFQIRASQYKRDMDILDCVQCRGMESLRTGISLIWGEAEKGIVQSGDVKAQKELISVFK